MERDIRLSWSAFVTAQYLEEDVPARERIDACVNLITRFPLIGTRLVNGTEHSRRFICGGFRIVYDLKETNFVDLNQEPSESVKEASKLIEITIKRFKRV